jgi:hypothetical protein
MQEGHRPLQPSQHPAPAVVMVVVMIMVMIMVMLVIRVMSMITRVGVRLSRGRYGRLVNMPVVTRCLIAHLIFHTSEVPRALLDCFKRVSPILAQLRPLAAIGTRIRGGAWGEDHGFIFAM